MKVDLISNSKELSEEQQGSNYGMAVVVILVYGN
jgi:hypothetical protein